MEQKLITIFDKEYTYIEHHGFVKFKCISYFMFTKKQRMKDRDLETIHQFDLLGYDFICEGSELILYFKKRKE